MEYEEEISIDSGSLTGSIRPVINILTRLLVAVMLESHPVDLDICHWVECLDLTGRSVMSRDWAMLRWYCIIHIVQFR